MRLKSPAWALIVLLAGCHSPPKATEAALPADISCSAIAPKDGSIVAGLTDGSVVFWDAKTGQKTRTLRWGTDKIQFLAFSRDGNIVGEDGADGYARIWRWNSDVAPFAIKHSALTPWIAISPDGGSAAIVDEYRVVKVIDTGTDKVEAELNRDSPVSVDVGPIAFSPDGLSIAVGTDKGSTRVWTLDRPGMHTKPPVMVARAPAPMATRTCLAFSANGRLLVDSGSTGDRISGLENGVDIWDLTTGREVGKLRSKDPVPMIALSPDNTQLVASSAQIAVWNTTNLARANHVLFGKIGSPNCFSSDGRYFTSYDRSQVYVYDAHTWKLLRSLKV